MTLGEIQVKRPISLCLRVLIAGTGLLGLGFFQAQGLQALGENYLVVILSALLLGSGIAFLFPKERPFRKNPFWMLTMAALMLHITTYFFLLAASHASMERVAFPGPFGWRYWTLLLVHLIFATLWGWDITSHLLHQEGFPRPQQPPGASDTPLLILQITLVVVISLFITLYNKAFPPPDFLSLLLILLLGLHRYYRIFLLDFAPLLFTLLAYETLRAFADNLSPYQIHVTDIIALERFLFDGQIPSALLQHLIPWPTPIGQVLRMVSVLFYYSHFVLPFVLSLWIWRRYRQVYSTFVTGLVILSIAGFTTFFLFPAAPPWWASFYGYLQGALAVHAYPPPSVMLTGPNPVAAMPSLHMAYPSFQALFASTLWGKRGAWLWIFPLGVSFATLYLGHHYVVDLLAGLLYAFLVFAFLYPWIHKVSRFEESP